MATTWQTITVRVERPPEASLGDFFSDMRSWLDHRCIMLADFRGVTQENKSGVFDVLFDNPRDALHFRRRFAASDVPVRKASPPTIIATLSAIDRDRLSIPAAIADAVRSLFRIPPRFAPEPAERDSASAVDLPITG